MGYFNLHGFLNCLSWGTQGDILEYDAGNIGNFNMSLEN